MSDTHFYLYVGCLFVTGLFLLASALTGLIGAKVSERIFAAIGGLAAVGYGVYLFFVFDSGTVREFFYVYLLAVAIPILVIYRAIQTLRGRRAAPPPPPAPYQGPGQPPHQPEPPAQAPQNPAQAPQNPVQHQ